MHSVNENFGRQEHADPGTDKPSPVVLKANGLRAGLFFTIGLTVTGTALMVDAGVVRINSDEEVSGETNEPIKIFLSPPGYKYHVTIEKPGLPGRRSVTRSAGVKLEVISGGCLDELCTVQSIRMS